MVDKFRSLGLSTIIVGSSLGMYLNFFVSNIGWNSIIILISLVGLADWKNLLNIELPSLNKYYCYILFYKLLCLVYIFLSEKLLTDHLLTQITSIGFIIALSSVRFDDFNFEKVILYSWFLSFGCILIGSYCCISGIYSIEYLHSHDGTGYISILSELTMGLSITTYIICSLFIKLKSKYLLFLKYFGYLLSVVILFIINKRTPIIVVTAILFAYWFFSHKSIFLIRKKTFCIIICTIVLLIILTQIEEFRLLLSTSFEHLVNGVTDMLTGSSKSGNSAVERYESRQWALNFISEEFSFFNYLFGAGYMFRWLDNPFLQSYLDMGIVGFFMFVFFEIIYPIRIIFSRLMKNRRVMFVAFLNFYGIFTILSSGNPYALIKWWPVILLIYVVRLVKSEKLNILKYTI